MGTKPTDKDKPTEDTEKKNPVKVKPVREMPNVAVKPKEKKLITASDADPTTPLKEKKQSKTRTHQGGKRNEVTLHPPIRRVTSHGQIVESKTAVIVFGRMNPPTIGHQRLVSEARDVAARENGHPMLFLSPTNNRNNPLTNTQKHSIITEAFGDIVDVREELFSNPITLLQSIAESYDTLIWVTGADQAGDYTRIVETYNGSDFVFESASVVSLSRDGAILNENISATQLRQAVVNGDRETFSRGLPPLLRDKAEIIFEQVLDGITVNTHENPLINKVREALIGG